VPIYSYECLGCQIIIDNQHPVGDRPNNCSEISDCKEASELKKLFNIPTIFKKSGVVKAGDTVNKFIEDSRHDLKKQKDAMKVNDITELNDK